MKWGPRLVLVNLTLAIAVVAVMIGLEGLAVPTMVDCLRILTRIGVLVFMVAVICRPLHDLVRSRATNWMFANRRYIGLSFAAWHLLHYPILTTMLVLMGAKPFWRILMLFGVPAAAVLFMITLMAATSFNGAQRVLGKRLWTVIHTVGLYAIWAWFLRVYVKVMRLPVPRGHGASTGTTAHEPYVTVYVVLLISVMAFRLAMEARRLVRSRQSSFATPAHSGTQ